MPVSSRAELNPMPPDSHRESFPNVLEETAQDGNSVIPGGCRYFFRQIEAQTMKSSLVETGSRPVVSFRHARPARLFGALLALMFTLGLVFPSRAVDPPASGRAFDTLTVRGTTYTRVTVVDISKRHVSFRSAQGFATVLLEDLE